MGREALRIEARAVAALVDRLGADFDEACRMLLACAGRVVVSGMGKSGHIGGKIAATLASTGTPVAIASSTFVLMPVPLTIGATKHAAAASREARSASRAIRRPRAVSVSAAGAASARSVPTTASTAR